MNELQELENLPLASEHIKNPGNPLPPSNIKGDPHNMVEEEAKELLPNVMDQLRTDLQDPTASVKERLLVGDKILDLAGIVTKKDRHTYGRGIGDGLNAGISVSKDLFGGMIKAMGDVFGVDMEGVKSPEVTIKKEPMKIVGDYDCENGDNGE